MVVALQIRPGSLAQLMRAVELTLQSRRARLGLAQSVQTSCRSAHTNVVDLDV